MGLHTVDPSDPESERHVLGYFSGFREALRKLVNADRAMRTPAEPAIDQKTSEKPELEHWTRDVWSVLFQDDHFRKSDKARIEKVRLLHLGATQIWRLISIPQIHGFLEDLKTHHLCPAVDTLSECRIACYLLSDIADAHFLCRGCEILLHGVTDVTLMSRPPLTRYSSSTRRTATAEVSLLPTPREPSLI